MSNEEGTGLFALVVTTDSGVVVTLHKTAGDAKFSLLAYVSEYWEQDGPPVQIPEDADEAIDSYFEWTANGSHSETWEIVEVAAP